MTDPLGDGTELGPEPGTEPGPTPGGLESGPEPGTGPESERVSELRSTDDGARQGDSSDAARPAPRPISMGDERLIEALRAPGCPLCSHRERSGSDYLAAVLYEQVNDGGFRERLLSGGGFCPAHTRAALVLDKRHSGGVLGAAILFRAALGARRLALAGATRSGRRGRRAREATGNAWSCPVCEQEAKALQSAVHRLIEHSAQDAGWHGWVFSAAWCLVHVGVLADSLSELAPDVRPEFVQAQLARLVDIEARLDGFVHHSSYDRRAQQTEQERRAVDDAAAVLSGVRRP